MTDVNSQPVSLPAGSYDATKLQKTLEAATKLSDDKYDAAVDKAVRDAATNVAEHQDARDMPGNRFVDVKRDDLGVTERVQVFDPDLAEKQGLTAENAEADRLNHQAEVRADANARAGTAKE